MARAVPADVRAEPSRARRSSRSSASSSCATRRPRARSSCRASASTRCGRRSTGASTSPTRGSTRAASARWASRVPAAIGAKVGRPDRTVWAIDGDGCFQMTAQELVTASIERIPIKVAHPEQQLPRHGAPVAGDVLRRALQRGVPVARPARLREVGRGDGLRRHPRRVARGGRSRPSTRPTRSTTARSSSSFRVDAREKVFPMVPAGLAQRRHRPAPTVRAEGAAAMSGAPATTSCRCSSRTAPACWPGWRRCSPGAASTSSRWRSRPPRTSGSAASRSSSTSSRHRSSRSSSSCSSSSTWSRSASSTRAARSSASCCWPPCGPSPSTRGQVVELVQHLRGQDPGRRHRCDHRVASRAPRQARRLRGTAARLWHRGAAAHRPGGAAEART